MLQPRLQGPEIRETRMGTEPRADHAAGKQSIQQRRIPARRHRPEQVHNEAGQYLPRFAAPKSRSAGHLITAGKRLAEGNVRGQEIGQRRDGRGEFSLKRRGHHRKPFDQSDDFGIVAGRSAISIGFFRCIPAAQLRSGK